MGWHYTDLTAATGAPAPQLGPATGYVFTAQGTQHVFYVGAAPTDGAYHIYELYWDSDGWHYDDLTAATATPSAFNPFLSGYAFEAQSTQHVFYVTAEGHIIELQWGGGGWQSNDLTAATGAPAGNRLCGYMFNTQGTQHLVFQGATASEGGLEPNGQIYELYWDSAGWHYENLTTATGAPLANPDSTPLGYAFEAQGTLHVFYPAASGTAGGHVVELYRDSNGWRYNDLTAATGAPGGVIGVSGNVFNARGAQHVYFQISPAEGELAFDVCELWWAGLVLGGEWVFNDLTAATGAPPLPGLDGPPLSYAFESQVTQHAVYAGTDNHVHELWQDSKGWHVNDLTVAASAPLVAAMNPLGVAYAFEAQFTQHVFYLGANGHIIELYWQEHEPVIL